LIFIPLLIEVYSHVSPFTEPQQHNSKQYNKKQLLEANNTRYFKRPLSPRTLVNKGKCIC